MATRSEELQRVRRRYRDATGKRELDHREVAKFAINILGWPRPEPKDPIDMLAKDLSTAARLEERVDRKTGISYRANLSYSVMQGDEQTALWVDTDEADRRQMILCATKFREQIVGEAFRLSNTVEHWNRTHPKEQPVQLELDLGPDVEWRRNSPGEDEKAV